MLTTVEEVISGKFLPARVETYILVLALYLIFVVGVLGNCAIIAVYVRWIFMRNTPNTYILSLSLANLLLLLTGIPLTSAEYIIGAWPFGVGLCKMSIVLMDISFAVSAFTFVLLSASRYFSIVDPLPGLDLEPVTIVAVSLTWLLAVALSIPDGVFGNLSELPSSNNSSLVLLCTPYPGYTVSHTYIKFNTIIKALAFYLVPLLIIAILYIIMNKKLSERPKKIARMTKLKPGKLVIAMVLVFAICFFPYHLFAMKFAFNTNIGGDYNWFWHAVKMTAVFLSFGHACVNPIVVYYTSYTFQDQFKEYYYGFTWD